MKNLLVLIILVIGFNNAKAGCLACWELRKVELTLTSGQKVTGYVKWNEAWLTGVLDTAVWKNRFPESMLPYFQTLGYQWEMELITEIFIIKNDSIDELIATKAEFQGNLDYNKVKSVRELDKGEKIYHGAGDILILSQDDIDRLKSNPFATYYFDSSFFGTFFLSYNQAITRKELSNINEDNYQRMVADFKKRGVVVYSVGY